MCRCTASLPALAAMSVCPIDRVSILRFRHLLEKQELAGQMLATVNVVPSTKDLLLREGTAVYATLIAAPSSTKNKGGQARP